jgi:hypothetical protein
LRSRAPEYKQSLGLGFTSTVVLSKVKICPLISEEKEEEKKEKKELEEERRKKEE